MTTTSFNDMVFDPSPYQSGIDALYAQSWISYSSLTGVAGKTMAAAGIMALSPFAMVGFCLGIHSAAARQTIDLWCAEPKAEPAPNKVTASPKTEKIVGALEIPHPETEAPTELSVAKPESAYMPETVAPEQETTAAAVEPVASATVEAVAEEKAAPEAQTVPAETNAPQAAAKGPVPGLDAPIGGKADDLKTISGIGPKIQATLNQLGVFHISQIAEWTPEEVRRVDDYLKFSGRIARENWIAQAKKLASRAPAKQ
jgi:predicted flap endonuclease-1-like 5' DNA nuclease